MSVLFLAQTLLGAAAEHYRADLSTFFGLDLARVLPYNLARTWHVQLSLFWTAAAFLAGGIFLVPFIARREPRRQGLLAYVLLGAVAVVVFGSLICEALSIYGVIPQGGLLSQQWEYLDLPRLWQILLIIGLFLWIAIIWRGMRARLKGESKMNMPWLFFFSGLAIPAFYTVGLLAGSDTHFTVADFWRFWVVHLWVEDFLELFTTVMVAYMFVLLGVVRERIALGVIFLDVILYSAGGVIGTMHHLYFSGTPVEHMALGAFFSAAEVIPLTFLTVEAWAFLQLGARQQSGDGKPFPHRWAVMFLVAVGFWNFLGAGIFGFLINLPIVSYYQIGTALTANHAHAAMMGVYGMLAVGLAHVRVPLCDPGRQVARAAGRESRSGAEHRPGVDGVRHPAAARRAAALPLGQRRLLRGAVAGLHHQARQRGARMAADARRRHPDRRRCPAVRLDRLDRVAATSAPVPRFRNCRNIRSTPKPVPRAGRSRGRFHGAGEGLTDGASGYIGMADCRATRWHWWSSGGVSTRWRGGPRRAPHDGAQVNSSTDLTTTPGCAHRITGCGRVRSIRSTG